MSNLKRILAGLTAVLLTAGMTACSDQASSSSSVSIADYDPSEQSVIKQAASEVIGGDETKKLENPTIKWLSFWDLNPTKDGDKNSPAIELFKEAYGGVVEYIPTSWATRYDALATAILGGDSPDFYSACDTDIFPRFALKGQFIPIDDYLDLTQDIWADTLPMADQFMLGDDHYVAVTDVSPAAMCVYNKETIDAYGLDDPATLYKNGEWNWNTFKELVTTFVSQSTDDQKLWGIDSWYYEEALYLTSGVPVVTIKNGEIIGNLRNTALERAQNFLYDLYTINGAYLNRMEYGWAVQPDLLKTGELLFYVTYSWDLEDLERYGGESVMLAPMPRDPEADEYYLHASIDAYAFVSGGKNPEGVAAFLNCKKTVSTSEEVRALSDQMFRDECGWSEDMISMYADIKEVVQKNPVYDYAKGCTQDLSDLLDQNLRATTTGTTWAETLSSIEVAFEAELEATRALQ